ncbi:hypothetical protein [Nocardia sp. NPDC005366]|uniref:hypothetical protein n=1 Tax=Nocardia sp. NPDC005366 TaxID=3156878 RepID=UPI0033A0273D
MSTTRVIGLSDGSVIVVSGIESPAEPEARPSDGTLSLPAEAAAWIGATVAAGITFDVLKLTAAGLVQRSWVKKQPPASAEALTETVIRYLRSNGYTDVQVTDIRKVDGEGWKLSGTANESTFRCLSDESGSVTHVRVK